MSSGGLLRARSHTTTCLTLLHLLVASTASEAGETAGGAGIWPRSLDDSVLVQWDLSVARAPVMAAQQREQRQPALQPQSPEPTSQFVTEQTKQEPAEQQGAPPQTELQKKPPASEVHGVSRNAAGDLPVFLGSLVSNSIVLTLSITAFSLLRRWFPEMYANNVRTPQEGGFGTAPFKPSNSFFGWIPAGLWVTVNEAQETSGLDTALLLEFANFAMKLLAQLGIPLLVVLSPLHLWAGGGVMLAEGDRLGSIGLNNIKHGSWLFTLHSFVVWYIVLATERLILRTMKRFLVLRFAWLEALEPPRSTSVLVEGLPEHLRSDAALEEYFRRFYPHEAVESACVVKHTRTLQYMVSRLKAKQLELEKARYRHEKLSGQELANGEAQLEDTSKDIENLEKEAEELQTHCEVERHRIITDASLPLELQEDEEDGEKMMVASSRTCDVCANAGFVTFTGEREALLAINARCNVDSEKMLLSIPPDPVDIRYSDLVVSPNMECVLAILGYAAIFGIFCSYMPFVVAFSTLTQLENLEKIWFFKFLMEHWPALATLIQGFFSTLGIVLFMSFLPSILMGIFHTFFVLRANAWAQLKLQVWYFWFLIAFVLLITAMGASLLGRVYYLMQHPTEVAGILADSLPQSTHFYLNYMVMQWTVHSMNLTRYIQLTKFFVLRATVGMKRAVELAEPEDQEYYGVGARSARWTLDLVLGLTFCSITPLMTLVTFLNFLITRVFYGYLVVFAETRKSDMGGHFYVEQMKHVQAGLLIYILLMMGVFARRAGTWLPVVIAGLALLPVLYTIKRFHALTWENMPLDFVVTDKFRKGSMEEMARYIAKGDKRPRYVQPELVSDTWRQLHNDALWRTTRETAEAEQAEG